LKGTRAYEKLRKAFKEGSPPPNLVTKLSSKLDDSKQAQEWGPTLDDTTVYIEQVIGYWSWTFKGAETRYSTTEREALAAKEGLVKFQPFIEGEKVLLVTDHSALQWARTYENSNRRLAAWGAIFSAYAPGLEIIHHPGRVHSNMDPLSRLLRAPPPHVSPARETDKPLAMTETLTDAQERWRDRDPALRATFTAYTVEGGLEGKASTFAVTRGQMKKDTVPVEVVGPPPSSLTDTEDKGGAPEKISETNCGILGSCESTA
jgi:hypothetical protein